MHTGDVVEMPDHTIKLGGDVVMDGGRNLDVMSGDVQIHYVSSQSDLRRLTGDSFFAVCAINLSSALAKSINASSAMFGSALSNCLAA